MLAALAGRRDDELEVAPSFADMGVALESVLVAAGDAAGGSVVLSQQYQLVLACCWLNLKECSYFLGELITACLARHGPGMDVPTLQRVVRVLRRVLTGCRHKGAIESARVAWAQLCTAALRHA
ncbi:uncharacterized protein LOC119093403 [Pollicipes pollicipes]|uniref:uncharacterized protein LOC119093403 n=1 Tax=Pollicipes pollicipes TaxID=41117 RepID=UPI001884BB70|nr:uncharacterized protein LOC119093403 [Pollicipes pollicipes]